MAVTRIRLALVLGVALIGVALVGGTRPAGAQVARIRDLVVLENDVPRRVVGYGLVMGLDGTGDRSFGGVVGSPQTVQSVVSLLRRMGVAVPPERLRLRNVAAVVVTGEISPYLRAGGRFDLQVASIGDATSLRNGVLWMTPLSEDVDQPVIATAQGAIQVADDPAGRAGYRLAGSARLPSGGLLEVDPAAGRPAPTRLQLRQPDLGLAARIALTINLAFGPGTAFAEDPGSIRLTPPAAAADSLMSWLAAAETLTVATEVASRLVIDTRDGSVVSGGSLQVGSATVSRGGLTLTVGGSAAAGRGIVHAPAGASVQEIAAALQAAGAGPRDIAAVFAALRDAGALPALLVVR